MILLTSRRSPHLQRPFKGELCPASQGLGEVNTPSAQDTPGRQHLGHMRFFIVRNLPEATQRSAAKSGLPLTPEPRAGSARFQALVSLSCLFFT